MLIKSVHLTNFRNHAEHHLDCQPTTTLILGENGCGKTSVLEAIYILTRGKSFRATDPEIIKRGAPFYRIQLDYDTGQTVAAAYDGATKTFQFADQKTRRLPAKAKYPIVLFEPQDLNLIEGSPARHRDYFDRIYSQLSDDYASNLNKYTKAVRQRNELLKSDHFNPADFFSWNLLLARLGTSLTHLRAAYTAEINQLLNPTYHSIADNSDTVELRYLSSVTNGAGSPASRGATHTSIPSPAPSLISEQQYLDILESTTEKDHFLGHTTFGVHHDNYEFVFNSKDASGSASRGEARSIIISLKFIEANILEQKLHQKPIVLLDDVFSELDESRRRALVSNFQHHQVILTSVDPPAGL